MSISLQQFADRLGVHVAQASRIGRAKLSRAASQTDFEFAHVSNNGYRDVRIDSERRDPGDVFENKISSHDASFGSWQFGNESF